MGTVNLNPDGPHDPENTEAVADLIYDATRFLNYASLPERARRGLRYPGHVYRVIGSLAGAASLGDQLMRQLGEFLTEEAAAGRVVVNSGTHEGRPEAAAAAASAELRRARRAFAEATDALGRAQSAITWAAAAED